MSQNIDPIAAEWHNRAQLSLEAGVPPGVHSLWIINKSGGLVYHKTYADIPHIDVNETMRLASMWCVPDPYRTITRPRPPRDQPMTPSTPNPTVHSKAISKSQKVDVAERILT